MRIIIGGCGRVGAALAEQLGDEGEDVVVVDDDPEAFERLGSTFNGETLVGPVADRATLETAGVREAGALVACTGDDNMNLMTAQLVAKLYDVPEAVVELMDPVREGSYRHMGVCFVDRTALVADAITGLLGVNRFPRRVAFADVEEGADVLEVRVGSAVDNLTVGDLEHDLDVRVAAVRRGDDIRLAEADLRLEPDDRLVAAVAPDAQSPLLQRLGQQDAQVR